MRRTLRMCELYLCSTCLGARNALYVLYEVRRGLPGVQVYQAHSIRVQDILQGPYPGGIGAVCKLFVQPHTLHACMHARTHTHTHTHTPYHNLELPPCVCTEFELLWYFAAVEL